jgi:hypothetical protein
MKTDAHTNSTAKWQWDRSGGRSEKRGGYDEGFPNRRAHN